MAHFELAYYFAALILGEYLYNFFARKPYQSDADTVASVSLAIPSFLIPAIAPVLWVSLYYYLEQNVVTWTLPTPLVGGSF